MSRFLLERLATMPLVAVGVITVLFVIFKSVPGDEASMAAGAMANQVEIEAMRQKLGLDRPLAEQYVGHVFGLLRGDFGYSSTFRGNPLWPILERIPATLLLMVSAISLTVLVGIPAGVIAGASQGRWPDFLLSALVVFSLLPTGFSNRDLREHLAPLLGLAPSQLPSGRLTYDLRRLRLHGLIERLPRTHRYQLTPDGRRAALFFTRTYARLFRSGLAQIIPAHLPATSKLRAAFDRLDRAIDSFCLTNNLVA